MNTARRNTAALAGAFLLPGLIAVGVLVTPLAGPGSVALVVLACLALAVAVALVKPRLFLYGAAALLPVWSHFEVGDVAFTFFELAVWLLFFLCLLRWLLSGRIQSACLAMPTPWLLGLLAALCLGALWGAPGTMEAANNLRKVFLVPVAFYLLVLNLADSRERVLILLRVFVLANTVMATYALFDHFVNHPEFRAGYGITSSVFLGLSCACGTVIAWMLRAKARWRGRRILEAAMVVQLLCLGFTYTRIAMACLAAVPFAYWILFRMGHRIVVVLLALAALSVLLCALCFTLDEELGYLAYGPGSVGPERVMDFAQYQDDLYLRFENWSYSLAVFRESPLFGHGFYPFYKLSGTWRTTGLSHPHSVALNLLVAGGVAGALLFLVFFVHAMWKVWPACRDSACREGDRCAPVQRALFLCFWCAVMNGLVNGVFIWVPVASLFFFFLALLLAQARIVSRAEAEGVRQAVKAGSET